ARPGRLRDPLPRHRRHRLRPGLHDRTRQRGREHLQRRVLLPAAVVEEVRPMPMTEPGRHPGLDVYCADLDAIHASDAISSLTGEELSRPGSLYALPMFCWADLGAA